MANVNQKEGWKVFDFTFIGAITFVLQLFFTVVLTEIVGLRYHYSYAIALALAAVLNYLLNRNITFASLANISSSGERFMVLVLIDIFIDWSLVVFLVEVLGVYYIMAITCVFAALSAVNFYVERRWVFK